MALSRATGAVDRTAERHRAVAPLNGKGDAYAYCKASADDDRELVRRLRTGRALSEIAFEAGRGHERQDSDVRVSPVGKGVRL
jgi:hypothetical protein